VVVMGRDGPTDYQPLHDWLDDRLTETDSAAG
jgi:hypothetical protein